MPVNKSIYSDAKKLGYSREIYGFRRQMLTALYLKGYYISLKPNIVSNPEGLTSQKVCHKLDRGPFS